MTLDLKLLSKLSLHANCDQKDIWLGKCKFIFYSFSISKYDLLTEAPCQVRPSQSHVKVGGDCDDPRLCTQRSVTGSFPYEIKTSQTKRINQSIRRDSQSDTESWRNGCDSVQIFYTKFS